MDREIFDQILNAQETITNDPEHQKLWEEWKRVSAQFKQQLAAMTPEQRETAMDYFGILIELHLRTLKFVLERKK